jgi:hypothetical protein
MTQEIRWYVFAGTELEEVMLIRIELASLEKRVGFLVSSTGSCGGFDAQNNLCIDE